MAKAKPGEVTYGSGGNGTMNHLTGQVLARAAGIQLTHIPYRGSAPAMNDLLGGQIVALMESLPTAIGYFTSGRMRPLAVSEEVRSPSLPDVPTFQQAGVDVVTTNWFGFSAPAGLPHTLSAASAMTVKSMPPAPARRGPDASPQRRQQCAACGASFGIFRPRVGTRGWAVIVWVSGLCCDGPG